MFVLSVGHLHVCGTMVVEVMADHSDEYCDGKVGNDVCNHAVAIGHTTIPGMRHCDVCGWLAYRLGADTHTLVVVPVNMVVVLYAEDWEQGWGECHVWCVVWGGYRGRF